MPDYRLAARRAAQRYGLDPDIFEKQIGAESGFTPRARSSAGAQGIAQFIPSTAKAYGVNLADGRVSDDLDGAARYMRDNLKRYGSYARALSAYNSGRPDAYKDPSFAKGETYNYVRKILGGKSDPGAPTAESSSGSRTRTRTVGGVDNSSARRQAIAQFVMGSSKDPLDLALSLKGLQDVPGETVTETIPGRERSSGGGKGLQGLGAVHTLDSMASALNVPVTAKQEPGHAAGGDHDPAVKGATARDYGGDEASRRRLFEEITRRLGVKGAVSKGADINVVKDGVRYQIISRDHGSGPHLHVGLRRVSR